jgi:hypothetical protein
MMALNWTVYLTAARRTAWGISQDRYNELAELYEAAKAAYQKAQDDTRRTPVVTEECREAFGAQEAEMRFFKKHYFLEPPLSGLDIVSLGLSLPNPSSPIPRPTAQPEADLTFPGLHLVELRHIRPMAGGIVPDPRSDYGVRIYYGLSGDPTDQNRFRVVGVPKTAKDLPYSLFTRRKRELFDFEGESGQTVYFCLQYEIPKGGQEGKGPFGPMLKGIVP